MMPSAALPQDGMRPPGHNSNLFPQQQRHNELGQQQQQQDEFISNLKVSLPAVPLESGPPKINFALLLDFAVQHTFHELTILSELLPKKNANDRKNSVVQFAYSTRLIFLKLLAIVKWIKISKKFDPLESIDFVLDEQSKKFVNTADALDEIRKELLSARLPVFQIAQAVDVLTLGTYPRLPQDIKDRFIPKPPLTKQEQALTLRRLNQLIQYELAQCSRQISPRFEQITIRNGMLVMAVSGEFEISLTRLGEHEDTKWCLLNIRVLVESPEVGLGQKLVHPLQVNYLHQIVQEKLDNSRQPLHDAYCILHTFCRMIQLDVLYCQVLQIGAISSNYVRVEEYDCNRGILVLSYWLTRSAKNRLSSHYRISIYANKEDIHSGLKTRHHPASASLPVLDEGLSLSRLISETILYRCRERLLQTKRLLESIPPHVPVRQSGNSLITLTFPLVIVGERHRDESLVLSINTFSGAIICEVPALGSRDEIRDLERLLTTTASTSAVTKIIGRLRILVMIERFNKAICGLQVRPVPESQAFPLLSRLKSLPADRRCLQFNREEQYYLVVSFVPDETLGVSLGFFLFSVNEGKMAMIGLDADSVAKASPISILNRNADWENGKDAVGNGNEKPNWVGTNKQLQAAVAAIDDRLLFLRICEELDKHKIRYDPVCIESVVGGHLLRITDVSTAIADVPPGGDDFFRNLVRCNLRLDLRSGLTVPFECTMTNCPLIPDFDVANQACSSASHVDTKRSRTRTWVQQISGTSIPNMPSVSEAVANTVIDRLSTYCHIYGPVKRFAENYDSFFSTFCNVQAFTYHKLVLAYGEHKDLLMVLSWKPRGPRTKAQYTINFGQCTGGVASVEERPRLRRRWNPHVMVAPLLAEQFNSKNAESELDDLVFYLLSTYKALDALYNFSQTRLHSTKTISQMLGIEAAFPVELQCHLTALDTSTLRLAYGAESHIEIRLLLDNQVSVRDCSTFVPSAAASDAPPLNVAFTPHLSLSAFWRHQAELAATIEDETPSGD